MAEYLFGRVNEKMNKSTKLKNAGTLAAVTHSAPVRRLIYSRCESYLVKFSQQLVLSLGAEVVTQCLSVDKGICEPKCESVK